MLTTALTLPVLLDKMPDIYVSTSNTSLGVTEVIADDTYDDQKLYRLAKERDFNLLVPPPKNAVWHGDIKYGKLVDETGWETRNSYVRNIWKVGRNEWKDQSGYHKRSLAETAMFRLKKTFGGNLKSKTRKNQEAEVRIRVGLLNLFTSYGMPKYET